ncbi:PREDICTED: uncharacterized protein LOC106789187 [Polistes canadensis]|uniref:uncharacterized protein LOC106789187 n=1 Tax=Polistes canadensis TaxID=91411 RepID=UPI000718F964|nr:PREDICTED: uncharacterized protein LOC106789187 [Polistes canadensis]
MEEQLKVPVFMRRSKKKTKNRRHWYLVKKTITQYLKTTPRLQIIFTNDKYVKAFSDECHCNMLPSTCYLLQIECDFPLGNLEKENILMSLVFPMISKLKIETYTFILKGGLFCQEIRFNCSPNVGEVKYFKAKIEPYFINDSPMQKCMIVFCRDFSIYYVLELFQALSSWFPENEIPVWGGFIDMLTVCQCCFNTNFCKIEAEMVLMFISSPDMKVWTLTLDETCKSKITIINKLTTFKKEVELKLHSVALMYVSSRRIENLYMLETNSFKEIFPNTILFPIYGETSFGGKNWLEISEIIPDDFSVMEGCNTTIMILTYN